MKEFISCINEKRQPKVSAHDGLQSTIVALACHQSVDTNQIVDIEFSHSAV